jgi:hypothetical protein
MLGLVLAIQVFPIGIAAAHCVGQFAALVSEFMGNSCEAQSLLQAA